MGKKNKLVLNGVTIEFTADLNRQPHIGCNEDDVRKCVDNLEKLLKSMIKYPSDNDPPIKHIKIL